MNNGRTSSALYNTLLGNPTRYNSAPAYNAIGRTTALQAANTQQTGATPDNFFVKRGKSIENAFGTTGAAIASLAKSGINGVGGAENKATEDMLKDNRERMNAIARKYGYNTYHDVWDARDKAKAEGDNATLDLIDNTINPQLKAQADANAQKANEKAAAYKDYMENNYVSQKINQDPGKFAGSAINTLSTAADVMSMGAGIPASVLVNAGQGAIEGVADELEQNGLSNFDAKRAAQNAVIGGVTGAATGALNKGITKRLNARGGNLLKGNNVVTRAINNFNENNALGRVASTLGSGAARGAQSGLVGGAVGAGLSSAMNNVELGEGINNTIQGALQGATQGAITGGVMAGTNLAANAALNKVAPNVAQSVRENQMRNQSYGDKLRDQFKGAWNSGDSVVERAYNDLRSDGFGDFGRKYNQFSGDSAKAIDYLLKRQGGEVEGVINSPAVESVTGDGSVDLVYGETGKNGYGLAHIVDKHGEDVARKIPSILENGKVVNDPSLTNNNRITVVSNDNTSAVRLDWDGKEKQWVVTAYEGLPNSSAPSANSQIANSAALRGSSVQSQDGATVEPIIPQNRENVNGSWQDMDAMIDRSIANAMPNADIAGVKDVVLENVANRLQQSGIFDSYEAGEMTDADYRNYVNAAVNDSVNELATTPVAQQRVVAEQPTATTQALSAWDRAAREGGYQDWNSLEQSFLAANPNYKATGNDAGAVLSWMDDNRGTWNPNSSQQTMVYDALAEQKATKLSDVPTSEQIKNKRLLVEEITKQFNAVDKPTSRSTKPVETFTNLYEDWGLSNGDDIRQAVSYAKQGALIPQMVREAAGEAGVVDLTDAQGLIMNLKLNKQASNKMLNALESVMDSTDTTIVGGKRGVDALQLQRDLQQMASDARGTNGTYRIGNSFVDETMARNFDRIAKNIGDKLDEAAIAKNVVPNVINRHSEDIQAMMNAFPENTKWQNAINDKIVNAKTIGDLRHSMKDLVRANIYISNGDENFSTFGGRYAANNLNIPTTKAGLINRAVNDVYDRVMGSDLVRNAKIDRYSQNMNTPTNGQTANTPTTTQASATTQRAANPNLATQLYNAIGRTEGLTNAEQARTANYLTDAVQDAQAGYAEPLGVSTTTYADNTLESLAAPATNGAQTTSATSVYDSVYSSPTGNRTSGVKTGYFQPTGDYWTDILAAAMSSAIDDNDSTAFASLYGMYQDALSGLQEQAEKTASASASSTKLTDKQRQANAAARALEDFENTERNFAYDVSDIPVIGNIANFSGNEYASKAEALALQIGYMLSGATINKEEAKKIGMAYVPQPRDNNAIRQSKINQLRGIISDYQQTYAE